MQIVVISPFAAERVALAELLRGDGHDVTAVATRPDGLDAATMHRAEVVIADAQVVGLDGLGLLRELAARGLSPRVIFVCPRASRTVEKHGVVCLTKPIVLAELHHHIAPPRAIDARVA